MGVLWFIAWTLVAVWGASDAKDHDKSGLLVFLLIFFLEPIGLIIYLLIRK